MGWRNCRPDSGCDWDGGISARTLDVIGMADALGRGALLSARAATVEPR